MSKGKANKHRYSNPYMLGRGLLKTPTFDKNPTLKCFREGCENKRNGNKLYCSAECFNSDKDHKDGKKLY